MKELDSLRILASDVVLLAEKKESNDVFMTLDMRMFSARVNANGDGVTKEFIDEIVSNQSYYTCLPLWADTKCMKAGNYKSLDHRYNKYNGTYGTEQIGSFCEFWEKEDPVHGGTSLYGRCRIPKRDPALCAAIKDMYDQGILCFSFEVRYSKANTVKDGKAMIIQAAPTNKLTGMAVVSVPAFEEAVAQDLVASKNSDKTDEPVDTNEVNEEMDNVKKEAEEANASTVEEVMIDTNSQSEADRAAAGDAGLECEVAAESSANAASDSEKDEKTEDKETKAAATDDKEKPEDKADPKEDEKEKDDAKAAEDGMPVAEPSEGQPKFVTTIVEEEYRTRITQMEEVIAQKDTLIAELQKKTEDYDVIKAELQNYKDAEQKKELEAKTARASAYAQKVGLNIEDEEVKNAIASFDYEKMADLVMAADAAKEQSEPENANASTEETNSPVAVLFNSLGTKEVGFDPSFGGLI